MARLPSLIADLSKRLPCPECGGTMILFQAAKNFYLCTTDTCSCRHTAHDDGDPTGVPADASTREARTKAHAAFDPLWQQKVFPNRSRAYSWLAKQLKIAPIDCHMGAFDKAMCERVVAICSTFIAKNQERHDVR